MIFTLFFAAISRRKNPEIQFNVILSLVNDVADFSGKHPENGTIIYGLHANKELMKLRLNDDSNKLRILISVEFRQCHSCSCS